MPVSTSICLRKPMWQVELLELIAGALE